MAIEEQHFTARGWAFVGGVVTLLIILHFAGPLQYIEIPIIRLLSAAQGTVSGKLLPPTHEEAEVILSTEEQLQKLRVENLALLALQEENADLRSELDFARSKPERTAVSYIIHQEQTDFGNFFTLDRGSRHDVRVDDPVIKNGVLLGKIISVEQEKSIAQLIADSTVSVSAVIAGKEEARGIVSGTKSTALRMEFIPQDATVTVGDTVISSGVEQSIPKGLMIGTVIKKQQKTGELFQSAIVEPPLFDHLRIVTILHQG